MDKTIRKTGVPKVIERTFVCVKPDGVQRGLVGRLVSRFEEAGLKIVGMKMTKMSPEFSKQHYSAHINKKFYTGLEKFMTSGPVIAMVLEGVNSVQIVRKIVGHTEPLQALPGTIRGDFAHHSAAHADLTGKAVANLIHASGNSEEAKIEVSLWFTDSEMYEYKTVHEAHVF